VPSRSHRPALDRTPGEPLNERRRREGFHGLEGPSHQSTSKLWHFKTNQKTSNGGGLGDRPAPRPQPCSVTRAIRCCHFLAGRWAGRQRRGRTRALSISEAGALSDSLDPIRNGTASAHRQRLTADQAYRTISYDGLETPIAVQPCGGACGARARDRRITERLCRTASLGAPIFLHRSEIGSFRTPATTE
jgi:hypothetical protein